MNTLLAEITWRPSFGDPDPLGWSITVAYLAASWVCFLAARSQTAREINGGTSELAWVWYLFAAIMLGLGLNKQLDLQILLTQVFREIAKQENLFAYRRSIQAAFVVAGAGFGLAGLAIGLYIIRGHWKQYGMAYIGLVLLLAFVVLRAATFNHVHKSHIPGLAHWLNAALELGGAFLVGIGALFDARRSR